MWLVLLSCWALTVHGQEPGVRWSCTGLHRSITYNTSISGPDAAHKCFQQGGMPARVIGENKACLTELMTSLGSGAQLEQTRVDCGDCSGVADCVTTLENIQNMIPVTMNYSTLGEARPFLCEIHDRCPNDSLNCSASAGCPQIDQEPGNCECHPGFTGDGKQCTPIASKAMPCVVTTTNMISSPSVATTTMPGIGATTNMTPSPGASTTTMPGVGATTNMPSSPGVTMTTPAAEASSSKSSNIGLYAGAGAGAVVLVLLIVIVALLLKRRRDRRDNSSAGKLHNVQHGSSSSGMGLLRESETSRPTLSSSRYEKSPTETSLGAVANSMDDADTTQEPDLYNVLHKDGQAGSGGSSQDAGATNTTPLPVGFYNTLFVDTDKEAGGPSASEVYASVVRKG